MATEEPKFTIESKTDSYEVRIYPATLVAETLVDANFENAGNIAFKILADYIFGNNKSKNKIEMTAPVSQTQTSEKIAMTAPVSQIKGTKGFLVQFAMPDKFTLNTLPEPNDKRVTVKQIPARKVAVYKYSGRWTESRYQEKLKDFLSSLQKNNIQTVGEPTFARYNPPFMPWFLRRNEIWMELKTE
ncbi:MAG: heme-binding protein [Bdellovibrionaceae bacterium]|nr:heme-binding protein [Pseudobdellovibrionaceae bacterium]